MSEFTSYAPGTPSWIDLATTDPAGAKAFYEGLFGWTAVDGPTDTGVYTMFMLKGKPVAGAHDLGQDMIAQGVPPHWVSYISVDNIDDSAARVAPAGGTVVQAPYDVMDAGRMAVVLDPTGASFALWQPGGHVGSAFANEHGSFTWNELQTNDTERAAAFYSAVLGWEADSAEMPSGITYTSFKVGDKAVAGMMAIQPEWGPVPPNWGVYLAVDDCDKSVARASELGGTVEMPAADISDVGRFALLKDPQGAYFYVISGM
jgi:predicted enzyme related to lactoylglutathione lyase